MRLRRPFWKTCCSAEGDKLEDDDWDDGTDENVIWLPLFEDDEPLVKVLRKLSMQDVQSERDVRICKIIRTELLFELELTYLVHTSWQIRNRYLGSGMSVWVSRYIQDTRQNVQ